MIENAEQLCDHSPTPQHTEERAKYWGVSVRVMYLWKAKDVPIDDDAAMVRWYLGLRAQSQAKLSRGFKKRLNLVRAKMSAAGQTMEGGEGGVPALNPHWAAFIKTFPDQASPDQVRQIQNLERHLHFSDFALQRAREENDELSMQRYKRDIIDYSKAIKEQKALADKLGVESGELLQKPEVERIIAAMGFHSMAAIDAVLPTLCRKLVDLKSPSAVRAVLEPALLRGKFLEPFQQAKRVTAGNALPAWVADKLVDAADDFLEGGKELMDLTEKPIEPVGAIPVT